jgi:hypothetical protein
VRSLQQTSADPQPSGRAQDPGVADDRQILFDLHGQAPNRATVGKGNQMEPLRFGHEGFEQVGVPAGDAVHLGEDGDPRPVSGLFGGRPDLDTALI